MKNMKLNEFNQKLSDANNNGQVSYLLYDVYGSITRYDVLSNIAELINGKYQAFAGQDKNGKATKTYKVIDKDGNEIKTNRLKLLVKSNLQYRLSMISGNSTVLLSQLLNIYRDKLTSLTIDAIYNTVNYTKIAAYLTDKKVKLSITTNWYPQSRYQNKPLFHITEVNAAGHTVKKATTSLTAEGLDKLASTLRMVSPDKQTAKH